MCCRYFLSPSSELRPICDAVRQSALTERLTSQLNRSLYTEGEIRPTNLVPVIAPSKNGERSAFPMVWGFNLPQSRGPLVNARVETAATNPTFSESWRQRRCIIPASYYFEWEHHLNPVTGKKRTGSKYRIWPVGSSVTWLAGLYRIEEINGINVPVFTVLTREPGEKIRFIHDRMPVIFPDEAVDEWIAPDAEPGEVLRQSMTEMKCEVDQS